jgi:hypothetical protein
MDSIKYVGMDVHKETVSIAVRNQAGKIVMDTVIETRANAILDCIRGIRGELHITFEEGTWAAWLYDLLHPHVARVVVCDPRRNALLTEGNKGDKVDAHRLAALLRDGGMLRPVYHGEHSLRSLRELARSYLVITQDVTRVMNRTKALYRGWGIPCGGQQVYAANHREAWLSKLPETGVRRRAEHFYQELDALRALRQQARLVNSRPHAGSVRSRTSDRSGQRCSLRCSRHLIAFGRRGSSGLTVGWPSEHRAAPTTDSLTES